MSHLLDAKGKEIDPLESCLAEMYRRIEEDIFGGGPDERVRLLRESILHSPQPSNALKGLASVIPWGPVWCDVVVTPQAQGARETVD